MIFLEMSRDEVHGGEGWGFKICLWSPTKRPDGQSWGYWTKLLDVRQGDTVIHLRGIGPKAAFVGYSTASSNGYRTQRRPPEPRTWSYAKEFFRVDLDDYTSLSDPVSLKDLFLARAAQLNAYYLANKASKSKRLIFFARQSKRLQCQNGGYLSEVDDKLFGVLFGVDTWFETGRRSLVVSVRTGEQLATVARRVGQREFSEEIRTLYGDVCCFPGCGISDERFLVGSHIARWSDVHELRGEMNNGLCLCLMHDKAFEVGLYTLDDEFRIIVNPIAVGSSSKINQELLKHQRQRIRLGDIRPSAEALALHRKRIGWYSETK